MVITMTVMTIVWLCILATSRPLSATQSSAQSKPSRDAHGLAGRRPRDKYASVKSSGYSRRSPPSKLTASKSTYSPVMKERAGLFMVALFFILDG